MPNGKPDTIQKIKDILKEIWEQPIELPPENTRLAKVWRRLGEGRDVFLTPETATEIGLPGDFPVTWKLVIRPGRNGDEPTFRYRSPEGLEFAEQEIRTTPEGEWLSGTEMEQIRSGRYQAYEPTTKEFRPVTKAFVEARELAGLSPQELEELASGRYLIEDIETGKFVPTTEAGVEARQRYYDIQDYRVNVATRFKNVFPDLFGVFEGEELARVVDAYRDEIGRSEQSQQQFFEAIQTQGRTPDTERLLKSLIPGLTDKDFETFFTPETLGAITEEGDFIEQSFFESLWDAFRIGAKEFVHKSVQWMYTILPDELYPVYGVTAPVPAGWPPEMVERVNTQNQEKRDKMRSEGADKQRKHDEWIEAHPEFQPPPRYREDVTQNLELLKEPGYWGHVIGEAATFSLAILGTILAVTFTTKNPYLGLAAGTSMVTPLQSQDLYEDLLASGAPEAEAKGIAIPVGAVIASVEAITDIPLLRAISPAFDLLKRGIKKNIIDRTMAALLKKGITTFATIEVIEVMEEVVQGAIQDAVVSQYDEDREMFANVDEIAIKTLIATAPLAIFGGGMSMRYVGKPEAAGMTTQQKLDAGWEQDRITGEWYKPELMVETYNKLVEENRERLGDDTAKMKALSELARTPEGEAAIKLYHGTGEKLKVFEPGIAYFAETREDAIAYAEEASLDAEVLDVEASEGMKVKDIDDVLRQYFEDEFGDPIDVEWVDVDAEVQKQAEIARKEGYNFLSFLDERPGMAGVGQWFTTYVALYPERLKIVGREYVYGEEGVKLAEAIPTTYGLKAKPEVVPEVAPEGIMARYNALVAEMEARGISPSGARLRAFSELARTPEDERALRKEFADEFEAGFGEAADEETAFDLAGLEVIGEAPGSFAREYKGGEWRHLEGKNIAEDMRDLGYSEAEISEFGEHFIRNGIEEGWLQDATKKSTETLEREFREGRLLKELGFPARPIVPKVVPVPEVKPEVISKELTADVWKKMSMPEKVALVKKAGFAGKRGSLAFGAFTKADLAKLRTAYAKFPTVPVPEVGEITLVSGKKGTEFFQWKSLPTTEFLVNKEGVTIASVELFDAPMDDALVLNALTGSRINRLSRSDLTGLLGQLDNLARARGLKYLDMVIIAKYENLLVRAGFEVVPGFKSIGFGEEGKEVRPLNIRMRRAVSGVAEPEVKPLKKAAGELRKLRLAVVSEQKSAFVKFAKTLPLEVRGKLLARVKNIKTERDFNKAVALAEKYAEKFDQRTLRSQVRKELKSARTVVRDKIVRGKFTPDVQRRIDVLTHNLNADRDEARTMMARNIQQFDDGELSYEEMMDANEALNFAGVKGMSADELAFMLEYIQELKETGRSTFQAKREADHERMVELRTDLGNILTGGEGLKVGVGAIPRRELAAKPGWFDTFVNWQYSLDNLADKLSKFDTTSKPYQSALSKFVAKAHRATIRQIAGTTVQFAKVKVSIQEIYNVKGNRDVNWALNQLQEKVDLGVFEFTAEYKELHPEAKDVFKLTMTRDEMISKYMQIQDSTLEETFRIGMGWPQKALNAVEANLTEQEKQLAESIFQFYDEYYKATNEVYKEMYNVDLPYNPRYSPIRRDLEGDIKENVLTFEDAAQYASTLNGSLKARVESRRPLKFNGAVAILENHITQMEHFKAWGETMRDFRRVFGNRQIRQAIEQYHGVGISKLMDKFMNQMARGGIDSATTNRVADFLRRAGTKATLAIKPVVGLKQVPSLFAYLSEMNPVDFASGIADFWASPVSHFKFLYKNSEGYRARISQGFERDIRAALAKHGARKISGGGSFTDWFLLQVKSGDTFAVTQGMWAKYLVGKRKGLSDQEALAEAEDLTNRTQPSFSIDTLSSLQNGGSWLKLMTMFQNQPNKYFRLVGDNLRNFKYGRGSRAKAASTILMAWVVLPMMFQFIADAFQWKPERQARAGLLGPLNFILIGGQLIQSVWGWITDEPFDYQISPVVQTAKDLQNVVGKAKKLVNQGKDPYKDVNLDDAAQLVEYLAKAVGQVTGYPTPYIVQAERQVREAIQEDEDIKLEHFLFSKWALEPPKKDAEGKVEEASSKLGEIREGEEEKPLTERPLKIYTTTHWFSEMGEAYKNVLPQTVLDDPKASAESKAWAQATQSKAQSDLLPNIPLYRINTEDNDDTIFHYYQQWKAREKIDNLPDLVEYDKLYPKACLGNVSRIQYSTLMKYLEAEDKDAFLENHPELKVNPRNEWLKANPTDNAYLALSGDAKLLTIKAYNEFTRLVETLDIPEDAIPELTLPPKESAENYFAREEVVGIYGAQSAESLLILAKDPALTDWYGFETPEQMPRYYELKIKNRAEREYWEKLGDKDLPDVYVEDEDERRVAFFEKFPASKFFDDNRRTEALSYDFGDEQIEAWVKRGRLVDEMSGNNPSVKLWAFENPEAYAKAIKEGLIEDKGGLPTVEERGLYEAWVGPSLKLQVKNAEEDEYWGTLKDKESPETYVEDEDVRREVFFEKFPNSKYFDDMERIEAYNVGFTEAEADLWAERGQLAVEFSPLSAEVRVWFADHPDILNKAFRNELMESDGTEWNIPADRLTIEWRDEAEEYDGIDPDAINPETGIRLRDEWLAENEEYRKDRRRIEFYTARGPGDETFTPDLAETYVQYYEHSAIGFRRERMFYDADGKLDEFGEQMHTVEGLDIPPFKTIPSVKYDDIYDQHKKQFDILRNLGNYKSPHYVEDNVTEDPETGRTPREQAAYKLRFGADGTLTNFGKAEVRRNGHGIFVSDKYIERFVEWQVIEKEGTPTDWPKDKSGNPLTWYEDDWYLIDHPSFYEAIYLNHLRLTERKLNLVPTPEVFDKYVEYIGLIPGKPREDLRFNNPDLEAWLLDTKKVTQSIYEKRRRAGLTPKERMLEELEELEKRLRRR